MIKIELSFSLYFKLANFSQFMYSIIIYNNFMNRFVVNRMARCKCSRLFFFNLNKLNKDYTNVLQCFLQSTQNEHCMYKMSTVVLTSSRSVYRVAHMSIPTELVMFWVWLHKLRDFPTGEVGTRTVLQGLLRIFTMNPHSVWL